MTLSLPLPPSQNHAYRRWTNQYGRRMQVKTKRATAWEAVARDLAYEAMKSTGWTCPQREKVIVELTIWWPDKKRKDGSNLLKLLLDIGEGIWYDDDMWALPSILDFDYDKANPRVDVVVRRK